MPISIRCPKCSIILRVADTSVGQNVRCPKCQAVIHVAAPASPVPPVAIPVRPATPSIRASQSAPALSRRPAPTTVASESIVKPARGRGRLIGLLSAGLGLIVLLGVMVLWWAVSRRQPHDVRGNTENPQAAVSRSGTIPETIPRENARPTEKPKFEQEPKSAEKTSDPSGGESTSTMLEPLLPVEAAADDPPGVSVPLFFAQFRSLSKLLGDAQLLAVALGKKQELDDG